MMSADVEGSPFLLLLLPNHGFGAGEGADVEGVAAACCGGVGEVVFFAVAFPFD